MTTVPPRFPWSLVSVPGGSPETYPKHLFNAYTIVREDHWHGLEAALNYLYGRHQRVYASHNFSTGGTGIAANLITGDAVNNHFTFIYIEPDVTSVIVWILAVLVANEYTIDIDAGGAVTSMVFPSGGDSIILGYRMAVSAGWQGVELVGTPTAPGILELEVKELMIWGKQKDSY